MKRSLTAAAVGVLFSLAGCGVDPEAPSDEIHSVNAELRWPKCPQLQPPGPKFCLDGEIRVIKRMDCIVGYECVRADAGTTTP